MRVTTFQRLLGCSQRRHSTQTCLSHCRLLVASQSVLATDGATTAADSSQWGVTYAMDAGSMALPFHMHVHLTVAAAISLLLAYLLLLVTQKWLLLQARKRWSSHTANSIGASYKWRCQCRLTQAQQRTKCKYEVKDTGMGLTYTVTPGKAFPLQQRFLW